MLDTEEEALPTDGDLSDKMLRVHSEKLVHLFQLAIAPTNGNTEHGSGLPLRRISPSIRNECAISRYIDARDRSIPYSVVAGVPDESTGKSVILDRMKEAGVVRASGV